MRLGLSRLTFLILAIAIRSDATTLTGYHFDELCEKADGILWARCVGSRSAKDDVTGMVYTTTILRALVPVKGMAGTREITLRLPGGSADGTTLTVPGFPTFLPNEEVVIFLTGRDEAGYPWPVGMGQGIYPVTREASGAAKVTIRPGTNPSPLKKPTLETGSFPEILPVADFIRLIQERLKPSDPAGASPIKAAQGLK